MRDEAFEMLLLLLRFFQQRNVPKCFRLIEGILDSSPRVPIYRLSALCLRAELHRMVEDYDKAEIDYREAIQEGEAVRSGQRKDNEFYVAYHPRAHLGLITALRRQLSPRVGEIKELIRTTRSTFADYASSGTYWIEDFPAQIDAIEGVFLRQIGDSSAALSCLTRAASAISGLVLDWYVFWHPEHIEAHRMLVCMMTPGMGGQGRYLAEQLLKRPDLDSWSRSAALAAVLHQELEDLLYQNADRVAVLLRLEERGSTSPGNLLNRLVNEGRASCDPTFLTEGIMLSAVWNAAAGNRAECLEHLASLAEEQVDPNLALLRGVEAAVLRQGWLTEGPAAPVRDLCGRGLEALNFLADRLTAYYYPPAYLDWCRSMLQAGQQERMPTTNRGNPPTWAAEEVATLRARLWP